MEKQFDLSKMERNLVIGFLIGVLVFMAFAFFGDIRNVKNSILSISPPFFIGSILLIISSYMLRFVKWHYYLKYLNINVPKKDSLVIFFIGLSMSITPGKLGELIKTYFLKKRYNIEFTRSAPIVLAERLTDLVAMIILIGTGVFLFSLGEVYFFIGLFLLLAVFLVLQKRSLCINVISYLCQNKFLKKYRDPMVTLYENTYSLIKLKPLFISTFISLVAWFLECVSIYIICLALNVNLSLLHNVFIYSFTTTIGALSMLPGGLGIVEGSMVGLFTLFGLDKDGAISATIIMRFITLWLGVFIGLFLFFAYRKKLFKGV